MTAKEKLLQYLATYPNLFIFQPVVTNVGFAPIDFSRGVLQDPVVLDLIAKAFLEEFDFDQFDVLAALPVCGISIATVLAMATKKPFVVVREEVKRPGRPKVMGGINFLNGGEKVVIVDDWLASGLNKKGAFSLLEDFKVKIEAIASFGDFDMREDERIYLHELRDQGLNFFILFKWSQLSEAQFKAGTIDKDFHELNLARLNPSDFADNSKGLLSRTLEYIQRHKIIVDPAIEEFFKQKGLVSK